MPKHFCLDEKLFKSNEQAPQRGLLFYEKLSTVLNLLKFKAYVVTIFENHGYELKYSNFVRFKNEPPQEQVVHSLSELSHDEMVYESR